MLPIVFPSDSLGSGVDEGAQLTTFQCLKDLELATSSPERARANACLRARAWACVFVHLCVLVIHKVANRPDSRLAIGSGWQCGWQCRSSQRCRCPVPARGIVVTGVACQYQRQCFPSPTPCSPPHTGQWSPQRAFCLIRFAVTTLLWIFIHFSLQVSVACVGPLSCISPHHCVRAHHPSLLSVLEGPRNNVQRRLVLAHGACIETFHGPAVGSPQSPVRTEFQVPSSRCHQLSAPRVSDPFFLVLERSFLRFLRMFPDPFPVGWGFVHLFRSFGPRLAKRMRVHLLAFVCRP